MKVELQELVATVRSIVDSNRQWAAEQVVALQEDLRREAGRHRSSEEQLSSQLTEARDSHNEHVLWTQRTLQESADRLHTQLHAVVDAARQEADRYDSRVGACPSLGEPMAAGQ